MTATTNFPFTNETNYTFDNTKIEVIGGVAKLKLQSTNADFTEDFADDTGFTYDNTKAEFTGGLVRQKDYRPANFTFGAKFDSSINANWGLGNLTATAFNSAGISGGYLDLTGSTNKYIRFAAANNASMPQKGCVKIKVTPNYSGNPANTQTFFGVLGTPTGSYDLIQIHHTSAGSLNAMINNSITGAVIVQINGAWNPTSGQEYEIEFDWDVTIGESKLFIDGIQFSSTATGVGTKAGTSTLYIFVGAGIYSGNTNFKIRDLIVFSERQHTANYTPGYIVTPTLYTDATLILPEMEHIGDGSILAFNSFSVTESNAPRYTLQIGRSGNYLYWDGSAWSISNGTYAQANTAADFSAHCATLAVSGEKYGQYKIHFTGSNTQQSVSELTSNMLVNNGYLTTNPSILINEYITASELISIEETATKAGSDEVKYTIEVSGQAKWSNSGTVENSNNTYSQANTETEVNAVIDDFVSTRRIVKVRAFLHSADGTTTPELDLLAITYNMAISLVEPTTIEIEGFLYDINGPVASKKVYCRPYLGGFWNEGVFHSYVWELLGTTDENGYLVANIYKQPANKYWELKIDGDSKRYYFELGSAPEQDFSQLSTWEVVPDEG